MNEELEARVDRLQSDVLAVMQGFGPRYNEPMIEDNMYLAVIARIRVLDPTILDEVCPEIRITPLPDAQTSVMVYFHRIQ